MRLACRRVIAFSIVILVSVFLYSVLPGWTAAAQTSPSPHGGFTNSTSFCLVCHTTHNATGVSLEPYALESAVCFTCHNGTGSSLNIETEMNLDPNSNALHPIKVNLPNNNGTYSYTPNTTAGIAPPGPYDCSQCHNPHEDVGNGELLKQTYNTSEYVTYTTSPDPYAQCWTCHNSNTITTDTTLFPLHEAHIITDRASCSACHYSPHGVAGPKMIRFNPTYVFPSTIAGTGPAYVSGGANKGSCTLTCHGHDHNNAGY